MMLDSALLVTLRGPHKTLDLELPGDVAIGELLPLLRDLLFEVSSYPRSSTEGRKAPPYEASVRLQIAGLSAPLPLEKTLIDVGVHSGTVLVLQTQEWQHMRPTSVAPKPIGRRSVQPGGHTGGIGVTWEPLM